GTPIALVNANGEQQGQVAWAARYTAWGEVEDEYNPNQIHQPIRFQGQQFDPETNLHYNRFRYYDPNIAQYVTQDPIGLNGGFKDVLNNSNSRVLPGRRFQMPRRSPFFLHAGLVFGMR
ncbi:RHS repeat-associated core domain-containing protein, partial [Paracidovorax sp. MALMAid1276]|uniref:RHS repeat-associated core domain-containing protein n=1 Tax=Paracidovorax sp. MALMAid1276 TaxID=3411631 RepID=UPI003B99F382